MPKIAFFEIEDWEKPYLKKRLKQHKLYFFNDELNENNVNKVKDIDILSVFIYSNVSKEILNKLKNLKLISTRSTGFDHIDLKGLGLGYSAGSGKGLNSYAVTNSNYKTDSAVTGITINNAGSVAGTNAPYIQLLVCEKD